MGTGCPNRSSFRACAIAAGATNVQLHPRKAGKGPITFHGVFAMISVTNCGFRERNGQISMPKHEAFPVCLAFLIVVSQTNHGALGGPKPLLHKH